MFYQKTTQKTATKTKVQTTTNAITTTYKQTTNVPATTTTATRAQTLLKLTNLTSISTTTDVQVLLELNTRLYTEALMRRLRNYNKILDVKMTNFKLSSVLNLQPRFLFVFPDASSLEEFIKRKIRDEEKQKLLKTVKIFTKIIAALVMSISFLLINRTLKRILMTTIKTYELRKSRKEKTKRKNKNQKRQSKDIHRVL